jgi:hypothetical protein
MNPNDMVKLKVLQGLKNHMNHSAGQRLAARVKPKLAVAGSPAPDPMVPPAGTPGLPGGNPGAPEAPGMPDDDKQRLMELYSKVK